MTFPPLLVRIVFLLVACSATALRAADANGGKNGYTVLVEIKANEKGEVQNVGLVESDDISADDVLTKMALAMALNTQVPPRMKDGKPVATTFRAPFFFAIDDDEGAAANNVPKPKVKEATQPVYPPALREQGVVGGAILELIIDADGKLTKVKTLRASHPEFAEAATTCIKTWTFTPAQSLGKPVESRTRFAFTFDTEQKMADIKWRIAPRPKLGSMLIIKPTNPIPDDPVPATAGTPAAGDAGKAGAPAAPTPAPAAAPTGK